MKNYLLILLVSVFAFGLSACPKGTVNQQSSATHVNKQGEIGYDVSATKAKLPRPKAVVPSNGGGNGGGGITNPDIPT